MGDSSKQAFNPDARGAPPMDTTGREPFLKITRTWKEILGGIQSEPFPEAAQYDFRPPELIAGKKYIDMDAKVYEAMERGWDFAISLHVLNAWIRRI